MKAQHKIYLTSLFVILIGAAALAWYHWGKVHEATPQPQNTGMGDSIALPKASPTESGLGSLTGAKSAAQFSQPQAQPQARPLAPFALSPGKLSLGDTVQDVLSRSDGVQAHRLAIILTECITVKARESAIELERAHPTGMVEFDTRRLKEQSDQLTRIKSECQTVRGDPRAVVTQLAELAYSAQVPGAAVMLLSLQPDRISRSQLERLASDARGGEWLSVINASVGEQVPVSDTERTEMLLALQRTFKNTVPNNNEFLGAYLRVVDKVWATPAPGGPGAMNVPRRGVRPSDTTVLPPDVVTPTDPQALARIERLTTLLTRQVKERMEELEAARRRAAGG